jgi:hypothetical protein
MNKAELKKEYWEGRWQKGQTQWDIGFASTPLVDYIDQLKDKTQRILIPGCGNAYEGRYLFEKRFTKTNLIDIAAEAVENIRTNFPVIPSENILHGDFFELEGPYDLILEQTFFSALHPQQRKDYARKCHELLSPGGKLAGVLFDDELYKDHPPFGGHKEAYLPFFKDKFDILHFERAYNSIKPRAGRELFIELRKM